MDTRGHRVFASVTLGFKSKINLEHNTALQEILYSTIKVWSIWFALTQMEGLTYRIESKPLNLETKKDTMCGAVLFFFLKSLDVPQPLWLEASSGGTWRPVTGPCCGIVLDERSGLNILPFMWRPLIFFFCNLCLLTLLKLGLFFLHGGSMKRMRADILHI